LPLETGRNTKIGNDCIHCFFEIPPFYVKFSHTSGLKVIIALLTFSTPTIMTSATYTIRVMDSDDTGKIKGKYATGSQIQGKSVEWLDETGADSQNVRYMRQFEHGQSS
jgi:hypothetical protein